MSLSYLQSSIDRLEDAKRNDVIEICINPDGSCWGEFQGDHFMSRLAQTLTEDQVKDLGNQIASDAGTPLSKDKPIVSVSITYRDRPIRAQVITPPAVSRGMSISLRFFSSLPLDSIELGFLYGKERKLEELRQDKNRQLREVVASGDIGAAIRHCVENKLNMIVSGGTSTGKTVAARKILSYVSDDERILTIEEAAELLPTQPTEEVARAHVVIDTKAGRVLSLGYEDAEGSKTLFEITDYRQGAEVGQFTAPADIEWEDP